MPSERTPQVRGLVRRWTGRRIPVRWLGSHEEFPLCGGRESADMPHLVGVGETGVGLAKSSGGVEHAGPHLVEELPRIVAPFRSAAVEPPGAIAALADQTSVLQHRQVPADRGAGDVERCGNLTRGPLSWATRRRTPGDAVRRVPAAPRQSQRPSRCRPSRSASRRSTGFSVCRSGPQADKIPVRIRENRVTALVARQVGGRHHLLPAQRLGPLQVLTFKAWCR